MRTDMTDDELGDETRNDAMSRTVKEELIRKNLGWPSSFFSYRCERGEQILVEIELGGFDTIREEARDLRCERCCDLSADWDGSLTIRRAKTCWKDGDV